MACARKLAVLGQLLSFGEPFRHGEPRSLQTKFSRLGVRATSHRRRGGVLRGTPRSPRYGHGRTRALLSLNQVLQDNSLPQSTPPPRGERRMLDEKRLHAFYTELQVASRVQVNRASTQIEEQRGAESVGLIPFKCRIWAHKTGILRPSCGQIFPRRPTKTSACEYVKEARSLSTINYGARLSKILCGNSLRSLSMFRSS